MGRWKRTAGHWESHAEGRAFLRHGLRLTWAETLEVRDKIEAGQARFVSQDADGPCSRWALAVKDCYIVVVYDKARRKLVTVYPDPRGGSEWVQVYPTRMHALELGTRAFLSRLLIRLGKALQAVSA